MSQDTSPQGILPKGILIYAQLNREKTDCVSVVYELAGQARGLATNLSSKEVYAVVLASELNNPENIFSKLAFAGIDKVFWIKNETLARYDCDFYTHGAVTLIEQLKPEIVLVGATCEGRDLAPRISARLKTGLTADCTGLSINEKGMLAATRPTFGGNLMATILCKTMPQMASVRPKVFPKPEVEYKNYPEIEEFFVDFSTVKQRVELKEFVSHEQEMHSRLDEAELIIAGGRGMKGEAGFELLHKLAETSSGSVGASRAAVEAGWAKHPMQVGQTGKTVVPTIYIACGISGAIQHLAGMNTSDYIIAINKDPHAPIFKHCDLGIVGDAFEILPELVKLFER